MITPQKAHAATVPPDKRVVLGLCGLLVMMVFSTFSRSIGYQFTGFDDGSYFSSNYHVKAGLTWAGVKWAFETGYASNWHPLTWLSLMLDAQIFGAGPTGPHFTNVLLHALNSVLLFLLLRRMTGVLWSSVFVAALFAVHPLRVESVVWVSERKDVLSGFFFMLTLAAYARYVEMVKVKNTKAKILFAMSLLTFACGLMSKPMLVTLPFLLLLLDYWPMNRFTHSTFKHLVVEKLPFLFLSAISCGITVLVQQQAIKPMILLPLIQRFGNALVSYVTYLAQTIWPDNLAVFYPYQIDMPAWRVLGAGVMIFSITLLAILTARRFPYFTTGWLWYLGMLVPAIGLIQVGGQARADGYTYLPQIGLAIAIIWAIRDLSISWRYRRQAIATLASVIIAVFMVCTWRQSKYWRTDEMLWEHAIACTSGNYVALNNLGHVLAAQGRTDEAKEQYLQALKFYPDFAEANLNLGVVFLNEGLLDKAGEYFNRALQVDPNIAEAYNNLGLILSRKGRTAEAIAQYKKAVNLNPDLAEIYNNLGLMLAKQGRAAEAVDQFQKALELAPDNAKFHYNLANIFTAQGRVDEAIEHYRQALPQMPDSVHGHYQLAFLLQSRGEFAAAIEEFQKVIQLDPKHVAAQNNLAWLLATCPDNSVRNGKKAVEVAEQAVQLSGGETPEILDTLAAAYAEAGRFPEAIAAANHALNLASLKSNTPLADAIQAQLKFYEADTPFRDNNSKASH